MKKYGVFFLAFAIAAVTWLAGCDSEEGGALPNRPPTTALTVAPNNGATVNHYIPLRWAANDPDGNVTGFWLLVDSDTLTFTAARDTTLAFTAPADGTPEPHTFEVIAMDGEGLVDDDQSAEAVQNRSRSFFTTNYAPVASFVEAGSIGDGATVGKGFQVAISATDSNPSFIRFSVSLDDSTSGWTAWSKDSVFLFADPQVIADTVTFPRQVNAIPNTPLTPGAHRLYVRVKDAGDANSSVIWRDFTITEGFRPVMSSSVTAQYAGAVFYPDGSAFHRLGAGVKTELGVSASAASYGGRINAYRYRLDGGPWSAWTTEGTVEESGLPAGQFLFEFMARDIAGEVSDPLVYTVRLVQITLSDSVIVIGATANGNGNPGSPTFAVVKEFYTNALDGYKFRSIDYADTARGITPYVSPFDLEYAGLIVWHEDDRTNPKRLNSQLTVIRAYLDRGGRIIFSAWDGMNGFSSTDTTSFAAGSFAREYFQLLGTSRNNSRQVRGFEGVGGFAGCTVDPAKLPASWNGLLDRCWVFRPKGHCIPTATLVTNDSATNPLHGQTAGFVYDLSFRVAVIGVPLFFCQQEEVRILLHGDAGHVSLIDRMLEGLESVE